MSDQDDAKRLERKQVAAERARIKKYRASLDFGPLQRIRVTNKEFPGNDVFCNLDGTKFGPYADEKEHDIPEKVVQHLNSLSVPKTKWALDPETGQQRSVPDGVRYRFSLVPVAVQGQRQAA